jgi:hypothetical protein
LFVAESAEPFGERITKLEVALGAVVENPLKPAEEQQIQHSVAFELKVATRRRRVFELRCLGWKIPDIQKKLAEEGQLWSEARCFVPILSVEVCG